MKRALTGLVLALITATACAPRRPYVRIATPPQEIVFAQITDGGAFIQDGRSVGVLEDLDPLDIAVRCVPDASGYVDKAKNWMFAQDVIRWASYAVSAASFGLAIAGIVRNQNDLYIAAIAIAPVSVLIYYARGLTVPQAFAAAVDAVNAYNDQYPFTPACGGTLKYSEPPDSDEPGSTPR